jgi:hypothetical protein
VSAFIQLKQVAYAQIQAKYACAHKHRELRHRVIEDSRETYVTQCTRCGHTSNPIKKKTALAQAGSKSIPEYDYKLSTVWHAKKSAEYFETYLKLKPALRKEYEEYLNSENWQRLRKLVFARAGNKCEICETEIAREVHHLTYIRIGSENLEDLLAVCTFCHDAIHPKRRNA